jgi:thiol-disulfide isomerase/thioredoxin
MQWISQIEAEEFVKKSNSKIKLIYYVTKICPHCDDFIPDIIEPLVEKYSDHFEGYKVDSDDPNIMFPPPAFPTAYFHIPNTKEKMPLVRYGGAPLAHVEDDFQAMIEIKDQGKTIEQAFFVDRRPQLFPYAQTRPNPRNAFPAQSSIEAFERELELRAVQTTTDGKISDWTKK